MNIKSVNENEWGLSNLEEGHYWSNNNDIQSYKLDKHFDHLKLL